MQIDPMSNGNLTQAGEVRDATLRRPTRRGRGGVVPWPFRRGDGFWMSFIPTVVVGSVLWLTAPGGGMIWAGPQGVEPEPAEWIDDRDRDAPPGIEEDDPRRVEGDDPRLAPMPEAARRQRGIIGRGAREAHLKNNEPLRQVVAPAAQPAAAGTVRIFAGDQRVGLGVVVRPDGQVLTKASELTGDVEVEFADGRRLPAEVAGVAASHDLALLRVMVEGLVPVAFDPDAAGEADAGSWLISVSVGEELPLAVGNVSVAGQRRIPSSGGLLGVRPGEPRAGIPVVRVAEGGAAEGAGLKRGDLIVAVNEQQVGTMRGLLRTVQEGNLDAILNLTVLRDGQETRIPVQLAQGQLGVVLATETAGVTVDQVVPGSGAEAAGIRAGDVITTIDDEPIRDAAALINTLRRFRPGDEVRVRLLREGDESVITAQIGYRPTGSERGQRQNEMGTRLSTRAVDFPAILQHDSILNADEMGGPLIDLQGRIVGLNIARAGRVETYALPADVVVEVLDELLAGRHPAVIERATDESGEPAPDVPLQD